MKKLIIAGMLVVSNVVLHAQTYTLHFTDSAGSSDPFSVQSGEQIYFYQSSGFDSDDSFSGTIDGSDWTFSTDNGSAPVSVGSPVIVGETSDSITINFANLGEIPQSDEIGVEGAFQPNFLGISDANNSLDMASDIGDFTFDTALEPGALLSPDALTSYSVPEPSTNGFFLLILLLCMCSRRFITTRPCFGASGLWQRCLLSFGLPGRCVVQPMASMTKATGTVGGCTVGAATNDFHS
jgi:hypothetical protein